MPHTQTIPQPESDQFVPVVILKEPCEFWDKGDGDDIDPVIRQIREHRVKSTAEDLLPRDDAPRITAAAPPEGDARSAAKLRSMYLIGSVLERIFSEEEWEISGEERTPLVRENHTAVCAACAIRRKATPRPSVPSKVLRGGNLAAKEAGLPEGDVARITSTCFSPYTSSFAISGTSKVYCDTFDPAGAMTGRTDTGETVPYRR